MIDQQSQTRDRIIQKRRVTLLELLDRLIDKGVVVKGEILLSVADVDLIYLNLGLLLSSVRTVENAARRNGHGEQSSQPSPSSMGYWDELELETENEVVAAPSTPEVVISEDVVAPPVPKEQSQRVPKEQSVPKERAVPKERNRSKNGMDKTLAKALPSAAAPGFNQEVGPKTNIDPKNVERGLAKLVLTLVELIRKLMEQQAMRRIEDGQLSAKEVENVGNAFFLLAEKMVQLKEAFGLADEDLNLDLGPLGDLL